MVLRSFLFSLQASYRFLMSTCYFAHVDGLSAKNMIPDLLTSAFFIQKVSFKSVIAYIIALNSFTLALKTSFQALKRCPDRFKTAIFSWLFEHVFTLKSLLERLKRNFDGSKIVSFQSTSKLQVSHFNMTFRSSRWFERRKHDSRLANFCYFHLEGLGQVRDCVHHCAQLVHFSTENLILSSKTSP